MRVTVAKSNSWESKTWRRPHTRLMREPSRRSEHFKNKIRRGAKRTVGGRESGPGGPAARVVGPVAIEPGHAPLDALAEPGKAAVLDDRVMHGVQRAVVQEHVGAAIAPRNVVGLPGPERGFMDLAIARDLQGRIPELAFFFPELVADRPQHAPAFGHPPVIARARQPEIQLPGVGALGRLPESEHTEHDAERRAKAESFQGWEEGAHWESAGQSDTDVAAKPRRGQ